MKPKPTKTLDDLHPPIAGKAQMIPLNLSPKKRGTPWGDYQQRYSLQIIEQKWDRIPRFFGESFPRIIGDARRHCPVVIAKTIASPVSLGIASPALSGIASPVSMGKEATE